jgi:hypothetical protein
MSEQERSDGRRDAEPAEMGRVSEETRGGPGGASEFSLPKTPG